MPCLPLPPVTPKYFLGIRPLQECRKYSKGWRNTFKEMVREYRRHLSKGAIQTRSWSHLHQVTEAGEASSGGFSKTLFYLPGRYHERRQESLCHAQRESERVLPHDYEIDQGQYYNAVDCKAADKREKVLVPPPQT